MIKFEFSQGSGHAINQSNMQVSPNCAKRKWGWGVEGKTETNDREDLLSEEVEKVVPECIFLQVLKVGRGEGACKPFFFRLKKAMALIMSHHDCRGND